MAKHLDLERQVLNLAEKDELFRGALLKDAKTAIEERFGIKTPEKLKIIVVEDTLDTVHLVLPPRLIEEGSSVAWA